MISRSCCILRLLALCMSLAYPHTTMGLQGIFSEQTKDILQIGVVPEKTKQLETSTRERDELIQEEQSFATKIKGLLEENDNKLTSVRAELATNPQNEYLRRKEGLLVSIGETLQELKRIREQRISKLDEYIKLLDGYLKDTDFSDYQRENKLQNDRSRYAFRDLERVYEMLSTQEWRITQIAEQEKTATAELESHKKSAAALAEEQRKQREELNALVGADNIQNGDVTLSEQEAAELGQLLGSLYKYKEQLAQTHIKVATYTTSFLRFRSFIENERLRIIKTHLASIKTRIALTDADIAQARESLTQRKKEASSVKEELRQELTNATSTQRELSEKLNQLSKQYNITLGSDLNDWSKEPVKTANWYAGMCDIGMVNTNMLLAQQQQSIIDARIALEDEKIKRVETQLSVKESYKKMRQLALDEAITVEIQRYEKMRTQETARLTRMKELVSSTADLITNKKMALDNIQKFRRTVQEEEGVVFRNSSATYRQCITNVDQAEQSVQKHIELLGQLTSVYSETASVLANTVRSLDFIIAELHANSLWHRPEEAISWEGFRNAPGDIATFFSDLRQYITHQFDVMRLVTRATAPLRAPWVLLMLLAKIFALFISILLFARYAPRVAQSFIASGTRTTGILRSLNILIGSLIAFVRTHITGIAFFISALGILIFYQTQDRYLFVLWCIALIPYLLYLVGRLIAFLIATNIEHNYVFLAEEYQRRFSLVISFLLSSTAIIVLFRTAFMLVDYPKSELPTILWAINYIIVQISLILLISKEQILYVIPSRGDLWQWIRTQVDRYYYLFLLFGISLIILSHPHVGLGQLVRRVLDGIVRTALLLILLLWLHGALKRAASRIFFSTGEDTIRERFANAKTWFGLLIISSFIVLGFFGFVVSARVWGWQITIFDVQNLLRTPFLFYGTDNPISTVEVLQLIGFALAGLLLSYAVNRFVFDRIFDLLPVDSGVQHTVTSISQYLIVIITLYIGFNKVGLGMAINLVIGGLILALGWIIKEPASDFIAYFIILVQRPIKIGDYIKIEHEISGVVRKITARSVILRKKNSVMIVVSNSYLLNKALINWNYTRNFIAFNDIILNIDFKEDPARVRALLHEAVEAHPNILRNPKPVIRLDNFSDFGYTFMVRAFISSVYTLEQWNIASDVRLNIVAKLRENNIKIAVPVRMIVDSPSRSVAHISYGSDDHKKDDAPSSGGV